MEVTTLLIPGRNDDPKELESLARFLVDAMGPETPWHVSRFHPTYRLTDTPPTPLHTLLTAREIGINAGLRYVYTGNVPGESGEDTRCPGCGKTVIERTGFSIQKYRIRNGLCEGCGTAIDGVEM